MGGALRHFLDGNHCTIGTDHQALRWIDNTTDPSSRLMRWGLRLAEFTFDVLYKSWSTNHLADCMSRAETSSRADDVIELDVPCLALVETAMGLQRGR